MDLVVVVPGSDDRELMIGALSRPEALKIRPPTEVVYVVYSRHDPGCAEPVELLRLYIRQCAHALVVFDREGSGHSKSREEIETDVERRLRASGWGDRARAVVIEPELEAWVWSDSPEVDAVLGWAGRKPTLREWLVQRGFLAEGDNKPADPKEALQAALREVRKPRSAVIYRQLAERVSLSRCTDPAFAKLRSVLREWFPADEG